MALLRFASGAVEACHQSTSPIGPGDQVAQCPVDSWVMYEIEPQAATLTVVYVARLG